MKISSTTGKRRWEIKVDSETRLRVWWISKPPTIKVFRNVYHSLDWVWDGAQNKNRELGIARLERNIIHTHGKYIDYAILYDCKTNEDLRHYKGSTRIK